jgi:hypothetical protein
VSDFGAKFKKQRLTLGGLVVDGQDRVLEDPAAVALDALPPRGLERVVLLLKDILDVLIGHLSEILE